MCQKACLADPATSSSDRICGRRVGPGEAPRDGVGHTPGRVSAGALGWIQLGCELIGSMLDISHVPSTWSMRTTAPNGSMRPFGPVCVACDRQLAEHEDGPLVAVLRDLGDAGRVDLCDLGGLQLGRLRLELVSSRCGSAASAARWCRPLPSARQRRNPGSCRSWRRRQQLLAAASTSSRTALADGRRPPDTVALDREESCHRERRHGEHERRQPAQPVSTAPPQRQAPGPAADRCSARRTVWRRRPSGTRSPRPGRGGCAGTLPVGSFRTSSPFSADAGGAGCAD